ncbi:coiled-coil domain-containing protein 43-like isoform X2 [Sinocyclocheilus rhinocerous]|uniref:coiled-coil domain-containing protein 43-like isoform X2 n=1 Tax=Sinocyclocheilus rhinocerous TaxID=307959 RepID=UPI0007B955AF|nr:PREDICTED: coiled-coil domain-containing protein 43-like isoform X2 [Sinocyclocheilus rhinocerous]
MAAPNQIARDFENWLNERLDSLEVDREVYGAYILGVLQEEENDEEQKDALQGILSAFLEEDTLEEVCQQILKQWTECSRSAVKGTQGDAEVQAIASLIEKQAQIVVKQKEVSEEAKKRKEALLAQYAQVTDEEDEDDEEEPAAVGIPSEKSLFKNTNVEDVLNRRKQQRDQAREDAEKKKEQDKMQREKDKLAKQERKDKEKKRTQKGERKR